MFWLRTKVTFPPSLRLLPVRLSFRAFCFYAFRDKQRFFCASRSFGPLQFPSLTILAFITYFLSLFVLFPFTSPEAFCGVIFPSTCLVCLLLTLSRVSFLDCGLAKLVNGCPLCSLPCSVHERGEKRKFSDLEDHAGGGMSIGWLWRFIETVKPSIGETIGNQRKC